MFMGFAYCHQFAGRSKYKIPETGFDYELTLSYGCF